MTDNVVSSVLQCFNIKHLRLAYGKFKAFKFYENRRDQDLDDNIPYHKSFVSELPFMELMHNSEDMQEEAAASPLTSSHPSVSTIRKVMPLQTLDLSGNLYVTDAAIECIAMSCPHMGSLIVSNCKRITGEGLRHIINHCRYLEKLDMSGCSQLTNETVELVLPSLGCLRSLAMNKCGLVSDHAIRNWFYPSQHCTTYAQPGSPHMHRSSPSSSRSPHSSRSPSPFSSGYGRSSTGLMMIRYPNLVSLSLSGIYGITDEGIKYISEGCPGLESLILSKNTQIMDRSLYYLSKGCTNLTKLKLKGCRNLTDVGINHLASGCHFLVSLDISNCLCIHKISKLAEGCPFLAELNLFNCQCVDSGSLLRVVKDLPIRKLNMFGCRFVKNEVLDSIVSVAKSMRQLTMGCNKITDSAIEQLRVNRPDIDLNVQLLSVIHRRPRRTHGHEWGTRHNLQKEREIERERGPPAASFQQQIFYITIIYIFKKYKKYQIGQWLLHLKIRIIGGGHLLHALQSPPLCDPTAPFYIATARQLMNWVVSYHHHHQRVNWTNTHTVCVCCMNMRVCVCLPVRFFEGLLFSFFSPPFLQRLFIMLQQLRCIEFQRTIVLEVVILPLPSPQK